MKSNLREKTILRKTRSRSIGCGLFSRNSRSKHTDTAKLDLTYFRLKIKDLYVKNISSLKKLHTIPLPASEHAESPFDQVLSIEFDMLSFDKCNVLTSAHPCDECARLGRHVRCGKIIFNDEDDNVARG